MSRERTQLAEAADDGTRQRRASQAAKGVCLRCYPRGDEAEHTKTMAGVEYNYGHPERYDGVSEWKCLLCGLRVGRWTGNILTGPSRPGARGAEALRSYEPRLGEG